MTFVDNIPGLYRPLWIHNINMVEVAKDADILMTFRLMAMAVDSVESPEVVVAVVAVINNVVEALVMAIFLNSTTIE